MDVITLIIYSIYLMLPAYLANGSALVFGGYQPLDFGKNAWDNRRIFGDGVTFSGTIGGGLFGMVIGGILGVLASFGIGDYFFELTASQITFVSGFIPQGLVIGLLLGFGALIGDTIGSFIKRRLNFERGRPVPLLDQLDFVVVSLIFISTVAHISWSVIIVILIISVFLHLGANMFAYAINLKDVWY